MSREKASGVPPDWVRKKIASLKKSLLDTGAWPENADRLLADLFSTQKSARSVVQITETDDDMLSLLVNDTLTGVDITIKYPDYYHYLLSQPQLCRRFLELLEMYLDVSEGADELLPEEISKDLGFLRQVAGATAVIRQTPDQTWQAGWRLLVAQLNQLFFQPLQPAVQRSSGLDDDSIILLRDEIELNNRRLELLLEAFRPPDAPDSLQLVLLTAAVDEQPLPPLQVSLRWGGVAHTITADESGRARFPLVPLAELLDPSGSLFRDDLQLLVDMR